MDPTGTTPAPNEVVRETVTMALYVCIVLAAAFVAAGTAATVALVVTLPFFFVPRGHA